MPVYSNTHAMWWAAVTLQMQTRAWRARVRFTCVHTSSSLSHCLLLIARAEILLTVTARVHGVRRTLFAIPDPVYRDDVNPVLVATEPWERGSTPSLDFATPYSGGLWWDPPANVYKMWYSCAQNIGLSNSSQCLATSTDGIAWTKAPLDVVPGTNIVQTDVIDGSTVWLDLDEPNASQRCVVACCRVPFGVALRECDCCVCAGCAHTAPKTLVL